MNDQANTPAPVGVQSLREVLLRVLCVVALRDVSPDERAAKIAILRKDGWL